MRVALVLVLTACGRVAFDARPDAAAPPGDSPALPDRFACRDAHLAIDPVAAGTALAVDRTHAGYAAMWGTGGAITALQLDTALAPLGASAHVALADALGVAGFVDTGSGLLVVTASAGHSGPYEHLWSLSAQLASPVGLREDAMVVGHEPFGADMAATRRVWVRGTPGAPTGVVASYIAADGSLGADAMLGTPNPLVDISADDGPDHAHIAWTEAPGICVGSDVKFTDQSLPSIVNYVVVSNDCFEARCASGPFAADSLFTVWRTADHTIQAKYLAGTGDIMLPMLWSGGRAPKVKFDGSHFWLAWLDDQRDELHLAMVDLLGHTEETALPGFHPVGDQAFQLVRRDNQVELAILSADALDFIATCS